MRAEPSVDWKKAERDAKASRLREIMRKDPELADWQLAERLGLSECQVLEIRKKLGIRKVRIA